MTRKEEFFKYINSLEPTDKKIMYGVEGGIVPSGVMQIKEK